MDKRHEGMTPEEIQAAKDERNRRDRERRAKKRSEREAMYKPKDTGISERQRKSLDKKQLYLTRLAVGQPRMRAAEDAGVHYDTVKYWRKTDATFREQEHEVLESLVDCVEDALAARITSDYATVNDMLKFLEKARPEKWGQKSKVEHEVTLAYEGTVEERLARMRDKMLAQGRDAAILDAYVVNDPAELPPG